jgi:uncharacterized protein
MMNDARSAPVQAWERIQAIDAIRGFALLGVLLMNLHFWFRGPAERYTLSPHPFHGFGDVAADVAVMVFFNAKSVTLFSFLFGAGLCVQLERTAARGAAFGPYAARRLSALLAFGLLHIAFLWAGDILYYYALTGSLLLLFLNRSAKAALGSGLALIALPLLVGLFLSPAPNESLIADHRSEALAAVQASLQAYGHGTWTQAAAFRFHQWLHTLSEIAGFLPYTLGMFLLGGAAWKRGVFRDPESHLMLIRRVAWLGLLGLIATAAVIAWAIRAGRFGELYMGSGPSLALLLATPPLSLAYAAWMLLLWRREGWRRRLGALAPLGRMALTNYLLQSLAMTWLFNGYGGGLYGRMGPFAGTLGLGLAFYALQILFSHGWLRRFQCGPVEWLWRCLTYGTRQPFRASAR